MYAPLGPSGAADAKGMEREPTAEEVEAVVAEQMRCLPNWWHRQEAAELELHAGERRIVGVRVVRVGAGRKGLHRGRA